LFVADEDIAPREEIKKFAVAKEIAPVVALGVAGFDE
jgi:hypothetical protein